MGKSIKVQLYLSLRRNLILYSFMFMLVHVQNFVTNFKDTNSMLLQRVIILYFRFEILACEVYNARLCC